jgi:hypothetical protein
VNAGANSVQYVIIGFVVSWGKTGCTVLFVTALFQDRPDSCSADQRIPLPS